MESASDVTWKQVVREALKSIGEGGHLKDINAEIEDHPKTKNNPTWTATVRRTLQQYSIFYQKSKGSGIWFLREEKSFEEFHPEKHKIPKHEDVQGMLLELGNVYGYETTIPVYDRQKIFLSKKLGEIVTLNEFPKFSYPKILKTASLIDVMWFRGETDGQWIPEFAFEVEHTTDVTKGLGRLLDLYKSGQRVKLFVLLPEEKKKKFDSEINRGLFSSIKGECNVRTYPPLIELYNSALKHKTLKAEFVGA
jgi:hypothetical protein